MNSDAKFFMIMGIVMLALVTIGPVLVIWQFQHPRMVAPKEPPKPVAAENDTDDPGHAADQ
jgi:hypothetical protein